MSTVRRTIVSDVRTGQTVRVGDGGERHIIGNRRLRGGDYELSTSDGTALTVCRDTYLFVVLADEAPGLVPPEPSKCSTAQPRPAEMVNQRATSPVPMPTFRSAGS